MTEHEQLEPDASVSDDNAEVEDPTVESSADHGAAVEAESDVEIEADSPAEPDVEAAPAVENDADADVTADAETASGVDTDGDAALEPDAEPDAEPAPESDVATEPEAPPRTAADISGAVEALLLLADDPVSETSLAQTLDVPVAVVTECLQELVTFYDETRRGFELRHVGEGWRYYTRAEHADVITVSVLEGQQARLSQAALETLAVVAYQQPITRGRISAVRGVNVDGVIRTLLARDLLEEAGADEDSGAAVFRTTSYFLERMGLKSLDELPDLAPHLPEVDELEAELGRLAAVPDASDAVPTDEQATDEQADEQPTDEQPTDEQPTDEQADKQPTDEQDADAEPDVAPVTDGRGSNEQAVVDHDDLAATQETAEPEDLTQSDASVEASPSNGSGDQQ